MSSSQTSNNNPYARRVFVFFIAIMMVSFQLRGSFRAMEQQIWTVGILWGEEDQDDEINTADLPTTLLGSNDESDRKTTTKQRQQLRQFYSGREKKNHNDDSSNTRDGAKAQQQQQGQRRPSAKTTSRKSQMKRMEPLQTTVSRREENQPREAQEDSTAPQQQQHSSTTTTTTTTSVISDNSSTTNSKRQQKQKPLNVVILYPDDWRHDDIGGVAPIVRTPFLNELARDGIRFTHNMVTTSICWVSRATLFTGQYVSRHQSYRLKTPEFYKSWHNTSWPALLQQQAGYYTGHIGKWQYHNVGGVVEKSLFNYTKIFEGKHQYFGGMSAALKTQIEVEKFLHQRPNKDQPFAVTAAFYPPKAIGNSFVPGGQWFPQNSTREAFYGNNITIPRTNETDSYKRLPPFFHRSERTARNRWKERFDGDERYQAAMKNYYSLITEVDTACRGIYNTLEKEGVLNNTLIIFTTDNGLFHGEHGLAGKWYPYQESIRVPLIIRDPRMPPEKRNTLDGSLTLNIDLNPTILGAAGITPPEQVQGRNIADLYLPPNRNDNGSSEEDDDKNNFDPTIDHHHQRHHKSTPSWRDEFLYEFPLDNGLAMPMSSAVVRKDIKYIYWPQHRYEQLFNLTEDPLELTDVYDQPRYGEILNELRKRHAVLLEEVK